MSAKSAVFTWPKLFCELGPMFIKFPGPAPVGLAATYRTPNTSEVTSIFVDNQKFVVDNQKFVLTEIFVIN